MCILNENGILFQDKIGVLTPIGVETPSEATIVCTGDAFTFKLNQALATYAEADGE